MKDNRKEGERTGEEKRGEEEGGKEEGEGKARRCTVGLC